MLDFFSSAVSVNYISKITFLQLVMEFVFSFFAPFFSVQNLPFFQMLMILSGLYTRSMCLYSVRLANLFTLGESALVWFVALMYKFMILLLQCLFT